MVGLLACGGNENASEQDTTDDTATDAAATLFASKGCAACHGDVGEGVEGVANTDLRGTRMIIQQFQTRVRNGKGAAMPAHTPQRITDDEIRSLWEWLRTAR